MFDTWSSSWIPFTSCILFSSLFIMRIRSTSFSALSSLKMQFKSSPKPGEKEPWERSHLQYFPVSVHLKLSPYRVFFWLPPPSHRTLLERGETLKEKEVQRWTKEEMPWGIRTRVWKAVRVGGWLGNGVQWHDKGVSWAKLLGWVGTPSLTSIDLFSNLFHRQLAISHVLPVQLHSQKPGGDSGHIKIRHLIVDIHPFLILCHHRALGVWVIVDSCVGSHFPQCCMFQAAQNVLGRERDSRHKHLSSIKGFFKASCRGNPKPFIQWKEFLSSSSSSSCLEAHPLRPTLALSASRADWPSRKTVSEGVFGFLEMLMSSLSRGTPNVTFLADTPA